MKFRMLLVASALALVATGQAKAADVVVEEAPPIEVPVFTWTGFYVGIQGGYAWVNIDVDAPAGLGLDNLDGGLFGGYLGYNWQTGPWVLGAEGDFNGVWNDETFLVAGVPGATVEFGTDWLASIRARAGYSFDRVLLFGTGGVAFTRADADVNLGGVVFAGHENYTGWTIGGGAEYAFTDNLIGRAEYRYYDFSDKDLDGPGGLGSVSPDAQTLTVGIAYKF